MLPKCRRNRGRSLGFIQTEVVVACTVLVIGVLSLATVLVSAARQDRQSAAQHFMLEQSRRILEEVKGTSPSAIVANYHGQTTDVTTAAAANGQHLETGTITIEVDDTNPNLLTVTVGANWSQSGIDESLTLETEVYSP